MRLVDICRVLKQWVYRLVGQVAGVFFNILNMLLAGNLPPFGCVVVIIHEGDRYLLLQRSSGKYVFPGGFIRWREHPFHAAEREVIEETGLAVHVLNLVDCFSGLSDHFDLMSTLTLVYSAEVVGGHLRGSIEGHPLWVREEELIQRLDIRSRCYLEKYIERGERNPA